LDLFEVSGSFLDIDQGHQASFLAATPTPDVHCIQVTTRVEDHRGFGPTRSADVHRNLFTTRGDRVNCDELGSSADFDSLETLPTSVHQALPRPGSQDPIKTPLGKGLESRDLTELFTTRSGTELHPLIASEKGYVYTPGRVVTVDKELERTVKDPETGVPQPTFRPGWRRYLNLDRGPATVFPD
jgi:hypothetical protein